MVKEYNETKVHFVPESSTDSDSELEAAWDDDTEETVVVLPQHYYVWIARETEAEHCCTVVSYSAFSMQYNAVLVTNPSK